jgi:DNA-nicking Smr family endonuclease
MDTELPDDPGPDVPLELPIDGVLDLHTFRPRDVKEVVLEYLTACREKGILKIRVIHGKGIGQLRQTVHALLAKHSDVTSYALASEAFGGWGATIVTLRPPDRDAESGRSQ